MCSFLTHAKYNIKNAGLETQILKAVWMAVELYKRVNLQHTVSHVGPSGTKEWNSWMGREQQDMKLYP